MGAGRFLFVTRLVGPKEDTIKDKNSEPGQQSGSANTTKMRIVPVGELLGRCTKSMYRREIYKKCLSPSGGGSAAGLSPFYLHVQWDALPPCA